MAGRVSLIHICVVFLVANLYAELPVLMTNNTELTTGFRSTYNNRLSNPDDRIILGGSLGGQRRFFSSQLYMGYGLSLGSFNYATLYGLVNYHNMMHVNLRTGSLAIKVNNLYTGFPVAINSSIVWPLWQKPTAQHVVLDNYKGEVTRYLYFIKYLPEFSVTLSSQSKNNFSSLLRIGYKRYSDYYGQRSNIDFQLGLEKNKMLTPYLAGGLYLGRIILDKLPKKISSTANSTYLKASVILSFGAVRNTKLADINDLSGYKPTTHIKQNDSWNVKVITPAGRQRYLKYLYQHLKSQRQYFKSWDLWLNTTNQDDLAYIRQLASDNDWIVLKKPINPEKFSSHLNSNIWQFSQGYDDPAALYIRLDDDIVWMEPDFIYNFSRFRVENRLPPLIYANIVNNNYMDYYHQLSGGLAKGRGFPDIDKSAGGVIWHNGELASQVHTQFQSDIKLGLLDLWKFDNMLIDNGRRVSINAISWIGGQYDDFSANIPEVGDDEHFSSVVVAQKYGSHMIYGKGLVAHAAFYKQRQTGREFIDSSVDQYRNFLPEPIE